MNKNIQDLVLTSEEVSKTYKRTRFNGILADYYRRKAEDLRLNPFDEESYKKSFVYENAAYNIENCNSHWLFKHFIGQKVKAKKGSMSCHNKFCYNCQKLIQTQRRERFEKELALHSDECEYYHLVLTVPNVKINPINNKLEGAIDDMLAKFRILIKYLSCSGNNKMKFIDFGYLGFKGAIRSLEVKIKKMEYHPHIHCLIALNKGLSFPGANYNKFSKNRDGSVTLFSDFEVLIQKIWYLLMNNMRLNLENIAGLKNGYSCFMRPFQDGNYSEMFKYITKVDDDIDRFMNYIEFLGLEEASYKRKVIQGYGLFRKIKVDEIIDEETVAGIYKKIIALLEAVEAPVDCKERLLDVYKNMIKSDTLYISPSKIRQLQQDYGNALDFDIVFDLLEAAEVVRLPRPEKLNPEQQLRFQYLLNLHNENYQKNDDHNSLCSMSDIKTPKIDNDQSNVSNLCAKAFLSKKQ